jgi:hypothetical protein
VAPEPTAPDEMADPDIGLALTALSAGFPAFRFRCEPAGWHRESRWVAERVNGLTPGLHTLITADLTELEAALARDQARAVRW